MNVKVYAMNKGTESQYYGLMTNEKQILPYTPKWKTEKGAKRWAEKQGLEVVKQSRNGRGTTPQPSKQVGNLFSDEASRIIKRKRGKSI